MEEELEADKQDETHPLTNGKKLKSIIDYITGFVCHPQSQTWYLFAYR